MLEEREDTVVVHLAVIVRRGPRSAGSDGVVVGRLGFGPRLCVERARRGRERSVDGLEAGGQRVVDDDVLARVEGVTTRTSTRTRSPAWAWLCERSGTEASAVRRASEVTVLTSLRTKKPRSIASVGSSFLA